MAELILPAGVATVPRTSQVKTYRVRAIWKTLQGEGLFAGRPAVFVRFVGCNMWSGYEADRERDAVRTGAGCPLWCDTEFTKEGSQAYAADRLVDVMNEVGGAVRFCVLTGGEPLLQLDVILLKALQEAGWLVAVETNGTVSLQTLWDSEEGERVLPDWIVCSPKLPEDQLQLELFDELKLVVPDYRPEQYTTFARRRRFHDVGGHTIPLLWLQPEDGPRMQEARQLAIETALAHPEWRVSVQTHKILDVE